MAARGNYSRSSDRSRRDSVHDHDYDNYSDSFVSDDSEEMRRKSRTKPVTRKPGSLFDFCHIVNV